MLPRLRKLFGLESRLARRDRFRPRFRPQVESLEDRVVPAVTFTVNTTADTHLDTGNLVHKAAGEDSNGNVSLRSAVEAANGLVSTAASPTTISVPAGTYILSINNLSSTNTTSPDDLVVGSATNLGTSIIGTGSDPSKVIIKPSAAAAGAANGSDVIEGALDTGFNADLPLALTLQNLEVTGGTAAAIFVGAENVAATQHSVTTLTNCIITGNTDAQFQGGAVVNITGDLTVTNSMFTTNSATSATVGQGGAIYFMVSNTSGQFSHGSLSVTGSTFQNNSASNATAGQVAGGAIYVQGTTTSGNSCTVSDCTFLGNSAPGGDVGGAVANAGLLKLTVTGSRFFGNTATGGGSGVGEQGTDTPAAVDGNWWGANGGPGATGADTFKSASGTATPPNNWLDLILTPGSSSIQTNSSTGLTATVVSATSSTTGTTAITGTALEGLSVAFAAGSVAGTSVNPTAAAIANGTAGTTFFSGSTEGTAHPSVALDHQTTTTTIAIARPATTVSSINRHDASPTNAGSVSWDVTFGTSLSGLTSSNFTLVSSGLGGTPAITTVTPTTGSHTTFTVTASTGTGSGSLGLNLTNDTGLDHSLSNLPFTGQVYTIDRSAPTVTTNNGLSVVAGGSGTIGSGQLAYTDPDDTAANITYTVTAGPSHGSVLLNGVATTTFTQADINNNHVTYQNNGSASNDSFTFSVQDALGNATTGQTFNITVTTPAQATVSKVTVGWGTQTSGVLADNGTTLLPATRKTDFPWLNINKINITLSQSATLMPGDVTVTGKTVANYGPVTISGSGTSYTITLAQSIALADRVTVTIGNSGITTYARRLDVLPGDFLDKGVVDSADMLAVYYATAQPYNSFADIDGDGFVNFHDVQATRNRIGTRLPPP